MPEFRAKFVCTESHRIPASAFRSFVLSQIRDTETPEHERFASQASWQGGLRVRLEIASDNAAFFRELDARRELVVTITSKPMEP